MTPLLTRQFFDGWSSILLSIIVFQLGSYGTQGQLNIVLILRAPLVAT